MKHKEYRGRSVNDSIFTGGGPCCAVEAACWTGMKLGSYAFVFILGPLPYEPGIGEGQADLFNPEIWTRSIGWKRSRRRGMREWLADQQKHHDGFCLCASNIREHSVKNSPCKRRCPESCQKHVEEGGIKFRILSVSVGSERFLLGHRNITTILQPADGLLTEVRRHLLCLV